MLSPWSVCGCVQIFPSLNQSLSPFSKTLLEFIAFRKVFGLSLFITGEALTTCSSQMSLYVEYLFSRFCREVLGLCRGGASLRCRQRCSGRRHFSMGLWSWASFWVIWWNLKTQPRKPALCVIYLFGVFLLFGNFSLLLHYLKTPDSREQLMKDVESCSHPTAASRDAALFISDNHFISTSCLQYEVLVLWCSPLPITI